jgi:hypothetical protein
MSQLYKTEVEDINDLTLRTSQDLESCHKSNGSGLKC